ncbi:MAG: glycosyl hydrolase 108 family protein [Rikenellaceae bacterium]
MDGRKVVRFKFDNGQWRSKVYYPTSEKEEDEHKQEEQIKKVISKKSVWSKPKYDEEKYEGYIEYLMGIEKPKIYINKNIVSKFKIPMDDYKQTQDWILNKIIEHEGGFSDIVGDPGGKTNRGISWDTWKSFAKPTLGLEPTVENLKSITIDDAKKIYIENFWKTYRVDEIANVDLKYAFFDFCINAPVGSITAFQTILNREFNKDIVIDGIIGSKTIEAINSVDQEKLYNEFIDARSDFYYMQEQKDQGKKKFQKGWQARVDRFRKK